MDFKPVTELALEKKEHKKILIQGPVSAGKSWLAGSIGTPKKKARFFEFDGKALALVRHPNATNIEVMSFKDVTAGSGRVPEPRAFADFIGTISELEYLKSEGKYTPAWNIIDSLTFLDEAGVHQFMYTNPAGRAVVSVGGTYFHIVKGWDAREDSKNSIMNGVLSRLFALDDLIVIAHERPEVDRADPIMTDKGKIAGYKTTGRYSLHPPRLDSLKSLFNDKYRVTCIGSTHYVKTQSDDEFLGACTLLDVKPQEEADLAKLIAKHEAAQEKLKQQQQNQTETSQ